MERWSEVDVDVSLETSRAECEGCWCRSGRRRWGCEGAVGPQPVHVGSVHTASPTLLFLRSLFSCEETVGRRGIGGGRDECESLRDDVPERLLSTRCEMVGRRVLGAEVKVLWEGWGGGGVVVVVAVVAAAAGGLRGCFC